ncbi:MAG: 30S ribosomal protein S2 [Candidatus Omnitrophota bacterium]|nr:30S ribosomal protein S2 [Candidatus Omnitrophota bacterium]
MSLPQVIKELLENGVHFGHLSKHWNPKMKKFIFGKKKNVYIIDLEKTAQKLEEAKDFIQQIAQQGGKILFVATKKQLRDLIKEQAISCQMPYVIERWVGGFLTNANTVRVRVRKYAELVEQRDKGQLSKVTKKELVMLNREIDRMHKIYSGVVSLEGLPECIFVVNPKKEVACVREANKLGIPIVALIDTDANPEVVDYPVPGNDDAIKSVRYIVSCLSEAVNQGVKKRKELLEGEKGKENTENSEGEQLSLDVIEEAAVVEEIVEKEKVKEAKHPSQQKEV